MPATRHVIGGEKLKAFARAARRARAGGPDLEVGFFASAKYPPSREHPKGIKVAQVAFENEFGVDAPGRPRIPERPFFRIALRNSDDPVREVLTEHLTHENGYALDHRIMELLGHTISAEIKKSIVTLRNPPNAPFTIQQKGSSNPLVDTETMMRSATHRVVG